MLQTPRRPFLVRSCCLFTGLLCLVAGRVGAQTYDDVTTTRNPVLPYTQLLMVEAGMIGSLAANKDPASGLDDELTWDGRAYYHDEQFGSSANTIDLYAGRDGFVGSIRDGRIVGDTSSRLQLTARPWKFYREGFYRGDAFVPVGRYEGSEYEVYLGFGRETAENLFVEFGPFWRNNDFKRSSATAANYIIPENYAAYGGRAFLEQSTLQLDRRSGMPRSGYLLTAVVEREWNDSSGLIGVDSGFQTELPSAVWRGNARLEWYLPQGASSAWEILATGALRDQKDRVINYESQRPQGNMWADAQLRWRLPLGDSLSLTPFVQGQYASLRDENGTGSQAKFFFGGGVESYLHFSETVSVHGWYSYLDNESRPTVSISDDIHGQHMFFLGMVLRLGGSRR